MNSGESTLDLDLIDFLQARLNEDAGHAPNCVDACTMTSPERLLAEVQAKRDILEMIELGAVRTPNLMLHALALPYADHPDYRQEWA